MGSLGESDDRQARYPFLEIRLLTRRCHRRDLHRDLHSAYFMATPYAFPSSSLSAIKSKAADQHASHSRSLIRRLAVVPYATDITRTAFWEKLHCKPEEYHAPAADLLYTAIDNTIVSNLAKAFCEYANLVSQKVHDALGEGTRLSARRV